MVIKAERVNEETGELFPNASPTWDDLAAAFARRERAHLALEEAKATVKALKAEDDNAQLDLILLGRRMRQARRAP